MSIPRDGLAEVVAQIRRGRFDNCAGHDLEMLERARSQFRNGHIHTRSSGRAQANQPPTAEVVQVENRPHTRIVVVLCPYAHRHDYRGRGHQFHTHGWPYGQSEIGLRVPPCDNDPGGVYRPMVATETK